MGTLDEARALAEEADRGEAPAPAADPAGAQAEAAPGAPPAPVVVDEAEQWIGAAVHFGPMLAEILPADVAAQWTAPRLENFGRALAKCAAHYGWKFGGVINHPVPALAVAAFPLFWPLAKPHVMPYLKREAPPAPSPAAAEGAAAPDSGGPNG